MQLLFIIFFSVFLRLISINQSLWLDEATTALAARMPLSEMFTKFFPGDFHPPLYYLLMHYWIIPFGSSEVSLRIPSVIFGVITIYLTYLIGKKLSNKKVGLIAAILAATSGLLIYYSQEARMYSLAAMLVSLSIYLFIENKWILWSLTILLIGLTDYLSLFIIPVFVIFGWKKMLKISIGLIPLLAASILWLPIFIKQISGGFVQKGTAWWNILGQPTLKNIILIPAKFIFGRIGFDNKVIYAFILIAAFGVFGYILYKAIKSSKILWYWLLIPVILGIVISFIVPVLTYFRFLFCLPVLYILIASGVAGLKNKTYIFFLLTFILINICSTLVYLYNPRFHREDWRGAVKEIGDSEIILPGNSQSEAIYYYGGGKEIVTLPKTGSLWLSRYVWEIVDPNESTKTKIENLGYSKIGEYNFNGVVFWKYSK